MHYKSANGLIVGSHFKMDGHWTNELDTNRLRTFMETVKSLKKTMFNYENISRK
jgi:predicted TIM-barrel enzyme